MRIIFIFIWTQILTQTNGQSCEGRCGQTLSGCSCLSSCRRLGSCCSDLDQFCLEISPHSGSVLGGSDFRILHVRFNSSSTLRCRFKSQIETWGYVEADGVGHCVAPMLFETGFVPFEVSVDKGPYSRSGRWLSVHHSKLSVGLKLLLVNGTQWQYYGTPGVGGILMMVWNSSLINSDKVNVELWGYDEPGEPYSEHWSTQWTYLYTVGRNVTNNGAFSFTPKRSEKPWSNWHMGSMRLSPNTVADGQCNVNSVWSGAHALAYHLEVEFSRDSMGWAFENCVKWDKEEKRIPNFLPELMDCPCTLAQARADTGRFHTDYGCDIEKGSVCTYHPGAVHCVRGIQASPQYGAGQQCCYDRTGAQILTGDSIGGSTPDRGHDWGAPPYLRPPRVPGLSHWKYDVISFYYCCLWSENCHYYFTHRPSSDCRTYRPPRAASVLGDPHFMTFDGVSYTFNGKGEYTLLHSEHFNLTVQGRTALLTARNGSAIMATRLSSVAMKEKDSDVIEVRLSDWPNHLQVLMNQEELSFSEQSWIDLKGVFVFSAVPQNVTVMFASGAGLEFRGQGEAMTLTVLLPQDFSNQTVGLLGKMNDQAADDLTEPDGTVTCNANASAQDIYAFAVAWAISNESSLFTYDSEFLLKEYYFSPKHDPSFIPIFSVTEDPSDPLLGPALELCSGEGFHFCKYDTLISRSLELGNQTLLSYRRYTIIQQDLEPVVSCGWLATPNQGQKEGTLYLTGSNVNFSCNHGYRLHGAEQRVCLSNGRWSGEQTHCIQDDVVAVVLGSLGAVLTLVALISAMLIYSRKQKRQRMKETEGQVVYQSHSL
ncbi:sushi domain-containing protein 2-like [Hoplias malabaricus]|uniref:sushi domain-containing protein 2-like n=1 Tax=Hoplias malabaricus TaxID=27720 RepID=UPI0034626F3B